MGPERSRTTPKEEEIAEGFQNSKSRRRIKMDLEDFISDTYGLKPANPFTLEQLVNELRPEN